MVKAQSFIDFLHSSIFKEKSEELKDKTSKIKELEQDKIVLSEEIKNIKGENKGSDTYYDFTSEFFKLYVHTLISTNKTEEQKKDCSAVAELFKFFLYLRMDDLVGDNLENAKHIYQHFTKDEQTDFVKENKNTILSKMGEQRSRWTIKIIELKEVKEE